MVLLQSGDQRVIVNQWATAHVDEKSRWLHLRQARAVHQMLRFRSKRRGQHYKIALLQNGIQVLKTHNLLGCIASLLWMLAHRQHAHAQRARSLCGFPPDGSHSDQAEHAASNFAHSLLPHLSLCPFTLLLMMYRIWQTLGQGKDDGNGMLGHHLPMHFARIGKQDIAGGQLRAHELMHRRRRGMDPAQFFRLGKLFRPQRPAEKNIGVADFLGDAFIIWQPHDLQLRKIARQPLLEPLRRLPQPERMINSDEQLHGFELVH